MAEFREVMKHKDRMCRRKSDEAPGKNGCENCAMSFHKNGRDLPCAAYMDRHPQEAEKIIMEWAAAHPEPRYPSWNETWVRLFPDAARQSESPCLKYFLSADRINCRGIPCLDCTAKPIPADIAEKLGIKPISEEAV